MAGTHSTPDAQSVCIRNKVTGSWRTWPEVRVRFSNLPPKVQTKDLYNSLEDVGDITNINIYKSNGRSWPNATVCFSPPPKEPIWTVHNYTIVVNGRRVRVGVLLQPCDRRFEHYIPSPCQRGVQYPRETSLYPTSMHFGFLKDPASIMVMRTASPTLPSDNYGSVSAVPPDLRFVLDLREMKINIYFPVVMADPRPSDSRFCHLIPDSTPIHSLDRTDSFKMTISLGEMGTISKVETEENQWALVIYLPTAPMIWKKTNNVEASLDDNPVKWRDRDLWRRSTHAVYAPSIMENDPISLRNDSVEIDFGRWTTYMLTFHPESMSLKQTLPIVESALKDFNIPVKGVDKFCVCPREPCSFWQMLDGPDARETGKGHADLSFLSCDQPRVTLPWDVRYQLESCISHGILNEYDITLEFLQTLAGIAAGNLSGVGQEIMDAFLDENMTKEERQGVEEFFQTKQTIKGKNLAAMLLESIMEPRALKDREKQGKRIWDPMTIFSNPTRRSMADSGSGLVHYCTLARKAVVTPTAVYLNLPSVEISNRVNRHYAEYSDYFLRIQFADERGRVRGQEGNGYDEIWARIFDVLKNGITIGGRTFKYLACGSSQLREHGAHLFSPVSNITPDSIRDWMGDFKDINIPAKYSARLGQCFSTTRALRSISVPTLQEIPDIERNGYTFSDGVGKISQFLARFIANEFGLDDVPSAFQIRLGGCKGMLAVWPDVNGMEVQYRPSQKKFDATSKGVEVVRPSQQGTAYLNRQIIQILECLGVEADVFVSLQDQQMKKYQESMTRPEVAMEMLGKCVDQYNITTGIATMVRCGFLETKEPFLLSVLHLWKAWSLKLLKEKARILIDQGTFVFGVIDELGTLKGHDESKVKHLIAPSEAEQVEQQANIPEIFLQVSSKEQPTQLKIVTGLCVVGRNPSLHPGDLRVVMAVDKPELRHLKDVVVFPSTGARPLPNMCSGGDLDGDDFFVFWDKKLIPVEWNYPPMNYEGPIPDTKDEVKVNNLIQFFVQYMKNDSLGRIAHAHLANADIHAQYGGPKHRDCLELVDLHSRAVDYVKTGAVAEMPKRLQPRKSPHFMEKGKDRSYQSTSSLGRLYDRIIRHTREEPDLGTGNGDVPQNHQHRNPFDFHPEYETPFDERILSKCPPGSPLLKTVRKIKSQYDAAMRRLMGQREIKTEFEIFTAFIMSKPRLGSDYELQGDVGRESLALKQRFRARVIKAAGDDDFEKLAPFVAAMYRVTQEEVSIALHETSTSRIFHESGTFRVERDINETTMPLTSFPWIFSQILCRMATLADIKKGRVAPERAGYMDIKGKNDGKEDDDNRSDGKGPVNTNGFEELGLANTRNDRDAVIIRRAESDPELREKYAKMEMELGYTVTRDGNPLHHGEALDILYPRRCSHSEDAEYDSLQPDIVDLESLERYDGEDDKSQKEVIDGKADADTKRKVEDKDLIVEKWREEVSPVVNTGDVHMFEPGRPSFSPSAASSNNIASPTGNSADAAGLPPSPPEDGEKANQDGKYALSVHHHSAVRDEEVFLDEDEDGMPDEVQDWMESESKGKEKEGNHGENEKEE